MENGILCKLHDDEYNTKYKQKYVFWKIIDYKKKEEYIFTRLISNDIDELYCDICFESKKDWITINKCNHKLCYECFQKFIINKYSTLYWDYIVNNSLFACPFCRTEFSFLDTSHYTKSKLSLKVWDVIYANKNLFTRN